MKRVVLIVAVFYGLLLILYLVAYQFNPSVFVVAGKNFTRRDDVLILHSDGYDGQFYYRLALNPLTCEWEADGIRFDNPPYRQQRILYPALAWLLGRVLPVPWALLCVNYVALLAIAALGVLHARRAGRSDWYALLFALWPGFLVSLTRDLTEPLASALLLAALLSLRRPWLAAALLSLAVLARETTLLAALAMSGPFILVPVAVYGAWQAALWARWGQLSALAGSGTLHLPPQIPVPIALVLLAFAGLVLFSTKWSRLKLPLLAYLALAFLASSWVWAEPYAYLRALTELYLLGVLICMSGSPRSNP